MTVHSRSLTAQSNDHARLIDRVIHYKAPLEILSPDRTRKYRLPGAANLARSLRETPLRYVLDAHVTRFCTQSACTSPQLIEQCLDLISLPAPRFWVEFDDTERLSALETYARGLSAGRRSTAAAPKAGCRVGLLVEADADGAGGSIKVCWCSSADDLHPDVSPALIRFSLRSRMAPHTSSGYGHAAPMADGPLAVLRPLNQFSCIQVDEVWMRYYRAVAKSDLDLQKAMKDLAANIWFDWTLLASFLVCLNVQGGLDQRKVERREPLYNGRKLRMAGRPEHVEVTSTLLGERIAVSNQAGGQARARRLHFVRGHLVRRADRIFWRSPHLRGDISLGHPVKKTINMKLHAGLS